VIQFSLHQRRNILSLNLFNIHLFVDLFPFCFVLFRIGNVIDHPERPNYDLSSLKMVGTGSQFISPELIKRVKKNLNIDTLLNGYGMTETNITHMTTTYDDEEHCLRSIGKPLPYLECKIIDETTNEIVPIGQEGQVLVRGYSVFRKYYDEVEKTAEAFDDNGWFKTGDVMYMDADGYFYFKNRLNDVIVVSSNSYDLILDFNF
jgi:long-subunit acyl-CoA synthetase (AMP-forming)